MLIDRPQVVEGSSIQNASVATGASFPSSPNVGELFFLTSGTTGLYTYNGSAWDVSVQGANFAAHIADDSRHITASQNTLLDSITVNAATINSIPAVTTRVTNVETDLATHKADDTRHLTAAENTLIDGITVDSATINTIPSVTSRVTTTENNLATHIADDARHLTANENTFLDGLNLPTLTATHVNFVAGTTSNIQAQLNAIVGVNTQQTTDISNLQTSSSTGQSSLQTQLDTHKADDTRHLTASQNTLVDGITVDFATINTIPAVTTRVTNTETNLATHIADDTRHLTAAQNTFIDGITVDFTQINTLTGISTYLAGVTLANRLAALDSAKLNRDGTNTMTNNLNMANNRISNVATPLTANDAATKDYVDSFVQGLHWVGSARVATIQDTVLSGLQTIDGIALSAGDRVLVKNQTTASQNGLWVVSGTAWSRANDYNSALEVNNSAVFVLNGTSQGKSTWVQTGTVTTVGGDTISFTAFSGPVVNSAGPGISLGVGGAVSVVEGAGLTFSGNAVAADVYPSGGIMLTTDDLTTSTAAGAQLSLSPIGTAGTYTKVTTDSKGRIVSGTNPTTLAGYGITLTSSNVTGALGFTPANNASPAMTGNGTITGAFTSLSGTDGEVTLSNSGIEIGRQARTVAGVAFVDFHSSANNVDYDVRIASSGGTATLGNGTFYVTAASMQRNGFNVLDSSNFNTYSPTLTGTGASGTWAINITGNASSATKLATARTINGVSFDGTANISAPLLPLGGSFVIDANADRGTGFNINSTTTGSTNVPTAAGIFIEARRAPAGSGSAVGSFQIFSSNTTAEDYAIRKITVASTTETWTNWRALLTDANFNNYSPTLTGTGASGTWGINITGNAATATNATNATNSTNAVNATNATNAVNATNANTATLATKANTINNSGNTLTFNWSGQSGQPTWLWGGNNPDNAYVYNPSNFNVAYATSAGSATNATNATNATSATNAGYATNAGNASTVSGLSIGGRLATDFNNYRTNGFYAAESAPANSPSAYNSLIVAANSDVGLQITGGYTADALWFRGWYSSGAGFTPWRAVVHNGNIGSQSVNYANSAGSATTAHHLAGAPASTNGTDGWFRSTGNAGWYNSDYATGIWSTGAGIVQTYNSGSFIANNITANGTFKGASGSPSNPTYSFNADGDTGLYSSQDGVLCFAVNSQLVGYMVGNSLLMYGDITAFSDERLKTNWVDIDSDFVSRWANVKHGTYDRVDTGQKQVGLSAQSVQEILPDAVKTDDKGMLSLNYGAASAVATVKLAQEVVELRKMVEEQAELIKLLMAKL